MVLKEGGSGEDALLCASVGGNIVPGNASVISSLIGK